MTESAFLDVLPHDTVNRAGSDTLGQRSDEELVAAVVRREQRALEELVRRHGGWAARFAQRLCGEPQLAEEVVQSAFLRLWNHAERWEGRARFSTWFYRVVHNLCIDQLRRARTSCDALEDELVDSAPTPPEQIERRQRGRGIQQALAQLPERQRTAIVLSHYEECTQAEAAAILGISEGALESLLSRGRATLRTLLHDQRH